jgi:hypothetical protein
VRTSLEFSYTKNVLIEGLAKPIKANGISSQNGQKKKKPAQCGKIEASKIHYYQ